MTILVFPSCLESSARFAGEARSWGQRIIGASCLDIDPYAGYYDAWAKLPYIGDDDYFTALSTLVEREKIDSVYSPHAPSFNFLETTLPSRLPQVRIVGDGPFKARMSETETALERAKRDLATVLNFGVAAPLPPQLLAGLLLQMDRLHGECSREKALGLCAIMPAAVKGDVIEIGSFFGKSTYLLNRLACYFQVGATLAVDPWNLQRAIQYDAPDNIRTTSRRWNWDTVHQGFLMNMLGCACPPFNYVRAASADAYARYCAQPRVTTPEFATTEFSGSISVLHIDGNHDEAAVAEDFELWSTRLAPGAWIVFDDYHWLHGDGPRNVGDRALDTLRSQVRQRFLAGGALFLNVAG